MTKAGKALILGCLLLLAVYLGSFFPHQVERYYARSAYPFVAFSLSFLSGFFPFSLGEAALIGLLITIVWLPLALILRTPRRGRRQLVARISVSLAACVIWLTALSNLFWGLNYARRPLPERQSWRQSDSRATDFKTLKNLTKTMLQSTNQAYQRAVGRADLLRPSESPDQELLNDEIDRGFTMIAERFELGDWIGADLGPAKPLLMSRLMSHLGLSGIYSALTAEANYNREIPSSSLPHTIAHEKAHQRGFASEEEANFIGFLACIWSGHPYIQYSGYLFAQQQLLQQVADTDLEQARELAGERLPGVARDLRAVRDFWTQYEGLSAQISSRVNDAYLRSNRVPGGIDSYRRSVQLIILYSLQPGAHLNGGQE